MRKLSFELLEELLFYSEMWIIWVNKLKGYRKKSGDSVVANDPHFIDFPVSLLLGHPKPPRAALDEGGSSPRVLEQFIPTLLSAHSNNISSSLCHVSPLNRNSS